MKTSPSPSTHEAIAACAYQLWEEAGRPTGREAEFWLRAERRLQIEVVPSPLPTVPPPPIPQASPHSVPPVIREAVQVVARPPSPAPSRKRRPR